MILAISNQRSLRSKSLRRVVLFMALTALLGACTPSEVEDPDAGVTLSGLLTGADGKPVGGAEITLSYHESVWSFLEDPEYRRATTDPQGRYIYRLKGRDLNYEGGEPARHFRLETSLSGQTGPPEVEASFEVNRTRFPLDLRVWDARAERSATGVYWQTAGSEYGSGTGYGVRFESLDGNQGIWSKERGAHPGSIDPRILEDTRGVIRLQAERKIKAPGDEVSMTYRSGPFEYQGPSGAPPSRGKGCFVEESRRRRELVPCPATDGVLSRADPSLKTETRSPDPKGENKVVVDLGAPMPIGLVVARNCNCPMESSEDGRTWTSLGTANQYMVYVIPPVSVRFVRVEILPGQSATEISIWPPSE